MKKLSAEWPFHFQWPRGPRDRISRPDYTRKLTETDKLARSSSMTPARPHLQSYEIFTVHVHVVIYSTYTSIYIYEYLHKESENTTVHRMVASTQME